MIFTAKPYRILAVLLLVISIAAHAQIVGGSISGLVKDSTGAALAGATVNVRQTETGATRTLVTNADGRFYAPSVPVGDYLVSVAHDGFETDRQSGISLAIGQSLQLNFTLGVEKLQQEIVVQATQSSVNTTTQQTAGLINERAGERAAIERPQLRSTAHAESGDGELHRGTLGRDWFVELFRGQHVCGERTQAAGQCLPAEWN